MYYVTQYTDYIKAFFKFYGNIISFCHRKNSTALPAPIWWHSRSLDIFFGHLPYLILPKSKAKSRKYSKNQSLPHQWTHSFNWADFHESLNSKLQSMASYWFTSRGKVWLSMSPFHETRAWSTGIFLKEFVYRMSWKSGMEFSCWF